MLGMGDGTFISQGAIDVQRVEKCGFKNVSVSENEGKDGWSLVTACWVMDSVVDECEDFFYNRLVTGLSSWTQRSFTTNNCTYTHCVRTHNPSIPPLHSLQASGCTVPTSDTNTQDVSADGCTFSNMRVFLRYGIVFHDADWRFSSCNFTNCISDGKEGGAIFCKDSHPKTVQDDLRVTSCIFRNCRAARGGAIYYKNISDITISDCQFLSSISFI